MKVIFTLLAFVACTLMLSAQTPQFKAPEGYSTSVQSVTKNFNFYKITRTIRLPWNRLPMLLNQIPAGNTTTTSLKCPSKKAAKFYDGPQKVLSSFGKPKRKAYQSFRGKDGDGAVLYFEFSKVLPMDAREQLSKYLFGNTVPPKPTKSKFKEQFLLTDDIIIIWIFENPKSQVRQDHQDMIFNLVSEMAMKQNPKK